MIIGGQNFGPSTRIEVLRRAVLALPTAIYPVAMDPNLEPPRGPAIACADYDDGMRALDAYFNGGTPADIITAHQKFLQALSFFNQQQDMAGLAWSNAYLGVIEHAQSNMLYARHYHEAALAGFGGLGDLYNSLVSMGNVAGLHFSESLINAAAQNLLHAEYHLERSCTLSKMIRSMNQGSLDPFAVCVDQNGIGFTGAPHYTRIGTENTQDCVSVVVWDPVTRTTALAHVDAGSDARTLQQIFDRMDDILVVDPETDEERRRDTHEKLKVTLIGARWDQDTSHDNINRVLDFLKHKDVEIGVANLLQQDNQPSAFIVDPKDGHITQGMPCITNPNRDNYNCIVGYRGQKPLDVEFDLLVDPAPSYLPTWVTPAAAALILSDANKTQIELINAVEYNDDCKRDWGTSYYQNARHHEASYGSFLQAYDEKIADIRKSGATIDPLEEFRCRNMLFTCGCFIGPGAANANQFILDIIEHDLFIETRPGHFIPDNNKISFEYPPAEVVNDPGLRLAPEHFDKTAEMIAIAGPVMKGSFLHPEAAAEYNAGLGKAGQTKN